MGNVAQTNVASINAQRNLFRTNNDLQTSFQRLASGFRINSARDDAAGLAADEAGDRAVGGCAPRTQQDRMLGCLRALDAQRLFRDQGQTALRR